MSSAKFKDIILCHYGPSYSAIGDIARQAEKDLGLKIEMQIETTNALINRAIGRLVSLSASCRSCDNKPERWMELQLTGLLRLNSRTNFSDEFRQGNEETFFGIG